VSITIAQCDLTVRILPAHRMVKAAGNVEPIILRLAFNVDALAHRINRLGAIYIMTFQILLVGLSSLVLL
jgi:hypothetical protein